jgi:eukaryotic-like serine/threonine-protein kinase
MVVALGQQLGNYQLTRLLGRGGFADVYLGKHIHLDTFAAVKVLHTHLSEVEVERFRNEARTIARLTHLNIVRVLDYGVQGTTPFLVMDYAPNGSLRQHHPKGLSVPLATIVHYVNQVAAALQYAHDENLVHRDVKPENILVGRRNEVLLSDFGIALVNQSSRYRSVMEMAGTIAYMAPEQIHAKPQPASDQYALGVIVYEWLSGEYPFHGSFFELASQHMLAPPPPLYGSVHGVSPAIERVVLTALAKDPAQRFVNVQAFANAFKQACHYLLQQNPDAVPHLVTMPYHSPSPEDLNTSYRLGQLKKGISRRKILVGGLAGLATLAGGTVLLGLTGKIPFPIEVAFGSGSTQTPVPTTVQPPGTTLYTYRGHSGQVSAVKWSPEGTQIASGSFDTTVMLMQYEL